MKAGKRKLAVGAAVTLAAAATATLTAAASASASTSAIQYDVVTTGDQWCYAAMDARYKNGVRYVRGRFFARDPAAAWCSAGLYRLGATAYVRVSYLYQQSGGDRWDQTGWHQDTKRWDAVCTWSHPSGYHRYRNCSSYA